jgi:hypothetical protein
MAMFRENYASSLTPFAGVLGKTVKRGCTGRLLGQVRISAIVDARFSVIVDGISS